MKQDKLLIKAENVAAFAACTGIGLQVRAVTTDVSSNEQDPVTSSEYEAKRTRREADDLLFNDDDDNDVDDDDDDDAVRTKRLPRLGVRAPLPRLGLRSSEKRLPRMDRQRRLASHIQPHCKDSEVQLLWVDNYELAYVYV